MSRRVHYPKAAQLKDWRAIRNWCYANWEDYVLTTGGIMFGVSLLPTILDPNSVVSLATSIPTALGLGMFALTMHHLGLRFTSIANATTAVAWALIALLRHG